MANKNSTFFKMAAACCLTAFFCYGCSLPRIIILNDPLSVEEHNSLGKIYQSQGKPDLAEQQYREALKKDPKSSASLLLLGDLSFQQKKYEEAESSYKKAMKLQPENGDISNNLCWVYLDQNIRMEEAEAIIRKALTLTPEHCAYYLDTLGVILLRQGRTEEAITEIKKAIELLPQDNSAYLSEAYLHLAESYRAAGNTSKAEEAEQSAGKYCAEEPAMQIKNDLKPGE